MEPAKMKRHQLPCASLYWDVEWEEACSFILGFKTSKHSQLVLGQFSEVLESETHWYLIRDRLGLNKLFYAFDSVNSKLYFSNYAYEVAKATKDLNLVFSVPAGHYLEISKADGARRTIPYYEATSWAAKSADFQVAAFQKKIEKKLGYFFQGLSRRFPSSHFVVCLSGGLDSAIIAQFARQHLSNLSAATFAYSGDGEDFCSAEKIATALGIPFLPIFASRELPLNELDEVLIRGQDWRDFNVHCAWVNRILARSISARFPTNSCVVLTGDLMNEFVADYQPVSWGGEIHYALPRVSRSKLRRFLVYGLEAGDREIGIFQSFGIQVVQPYSILAEDYLEVPEEIIENPLCKNLLNRDLIQDSEVRSLICKSKMRAQTGDRLGGVLSVFQENGMGQSQLLSRWEEIFLPFTPPRKRVPLIQAGRYRH